jgi:hypothetical protein
VDHLTDDQVRASGYRNRSLAGAFWKGHVAAVQGRGECPYSDLRGKRGKVTWSRAYRNAWMAGHARGRAELRNGTAKAGSLFAAAEDEGGAS